VVPPKAARSLVSTVRLSGKSNPADEEEADGRGTERDDAGRARRTPEAWDAIAALYDEHVAPGEVDLATAGLRWFDLCRDLTEQWVDQQHIRDAVGRPGSHDRLLPDVLRTFVWAFPHKYGAQAPEGTVVQVGLGIAGTWHLIRSDDQWTLEPGSADEHQHSSISQPPSPGANSPASP
jgi:hypothetical protein